MWNERIVSCLWESGQKPEWNLIWRSLGVHLKPRSTQNRPWESALTPQRGVRLAWRVVATQREPMSVPLGGARW
jgi:hypothetical protein